MLSTSPEPIAPSFWMSEAKNFTFLLLPPRHHGPQHVTNALQFGLARSPREMGWVKLHWRCKCILEVSDDDDDRCDASTNDGQLNFNCRSVTEEALISPPRPGMCALHWWKLFCFPLRQFCRPEHGLMMIVMIMMMMKMAGWWKSPAMGAIRRLFFIIIRYSLDSDEHYDTVCSSHSLLFITFF